MNDPAPAQLELIRRYARTLRELHADAVRARSPRIGARDARRAAIAKPMTRAAEALAERGDDAAAPAP